MEFNNTIIKLPIQKFMCFILHSLAKIFIERAFSPSYNE